MLSPNTRQNFTGKISILDILYKPLQLEPSPKPLFILSANYARLNDIPFVKMQ
ncbi:hypothetical protein BH11BAC2_BH11BAC2_13920 [soil metagenome]